MKTRENFRYIVGIDEAGRGPLAGPVAVGAFCARADFCGFKNFSAGVKDSKQLSEKKREEWYAKMLCEKELGNFSFAVSFASSGMIDRRGLSFALKHAIALSLEKLACPPEHTLVLLDGGLYAPAEYIFQETIIKGDEKEPVVSLASIAAKVLRDRMMIRLAKQHPVYGFEKHKGYGTAAHYIAIARHGVLEKVHRKSFLAKFEVRSTQ
ncbi:MAG: ribonuclease HII [Parcubacteria group bacterium]|nr:ribonuclease HII [Parcubacteria group bacterium]